MELQEWIDGAFEETETDYTIAGMNILYKNEEDYLKKGVELLCDKVKPTSVLEFGFGKGWTATEFQEYGINRHVILEPNKENYQMALDWKDNYSTDIEILNIFSWDYDGDEVFDLVYDDIQQFTLEDDSKHFSQMNKVLEDGQWYASFANTVSSRGQRGYSIYFELDNILYAQILMKYNIPNRFTYNGNS